MKKKFPSSLKKLCEKRQKPVQRLLNSFLPPIRTVTMGDSDDEYDRKRRDKFRGERGGERGPGGGERERWPERDR